MKSSRQDSNQHPDGMPAWQVAAPSLAPRFTLKVTDWVMSSSSSEAALHLTGPNVQHSDHHHEHRSTNGLKAYRPLQRPVHQQRGAAQKGKRPKSAD